MAVSTATALTPKQYAARLGVSIPVVLGYIASGDLAAIDVSSRPGVGRASWRLPADSICAFEAKRSARGLVVKASRRRQKRKDPGFITYF